MHVALELAGRQDLLEQRAQLDLGPGAARLDVGEHALEVADAGGQGLHLAQPLLHRLELVADQLEGLAETLLERGLQLLVHRGAHLLELLLVARLQLDDPGVDGGADAVEGGLVGGAELGQPLGDAGQLLALDLGHAAERPGQHVVARGEAARELLAGRARRALRLFARGAQLRADRVRAALRTCSGAHEQCDEQHHTRGGEQQDQPQDGIGHAQPPGKRRRWPARNGGHRVDATQRVGRITHDEAPGAGGAPPSGRGFRYPLLRPTPSDPGASPPCSSSKSPYVSDLLTATVCELGLPVLRTPMAERRLSGQSAALLCDDAAFSAAARRPGARLYSNSENAIGWIAAHLAGSDLPRRIALFKDKVAFRDLVADLYPDYRYAGVPADGLRAFDATCLRAPFIVKPAVGFFSLGVHVVESAGAWPAVVDGDRAGSPGAGPPVSRAGAGPGPLRRRGGDPGRGVRRGRLLRRGRRAGAGQRVRAPVLVGRRRQRPRLLHERRDGRPPGPAGRGVPRGDRPARRPRRLPRPHRAAHGRGRPRRADRGQPDALRRLVCDRPRALRVRHRPVPLLPPRRAPGLGPHRSSDRGAHHGAHRLRSA